ncbi:hypothetical protein AAC387_Pa02g4769 [Persea americana]
MAEALVSFVVKELCALAKDEAGLLVGVKKDVRKLSSTFTAIQAVLEDAERQQVTKKAVRDWLGKLKEVVYEVEDILDEWRIDAFTSHGDEDDIPNRMKVRSCLIFPCLCFKQVELRRDTGHRIREITERLKEISIEKSAFGFNEVNTREVQLAPKMEERQSGSLIDESEIFGRDHDKESIINELVSDTSREPKSVCIVSIVGMGGLGKTALAQLVYNDERVKKHFEKRIWFCVSDDFDVKRIATKVIQSMGRSTAENPDLDTMQCSLHQAVDNRKILLVLDDVWNENETLWENLRVPLKDAARGSRILVTTRNRKVAEVMETTHIHDLHILSDSDCWKLFTSRAFKGREEEECIELTEMECESRRDEVSEILGDDVEERMESVFEGLRSPGRDQQWGMVGDDEIERMKSVFEGLRPPHSDLRKLKILNYVGSKFPTWLEDSKFPSLVKVVLKDCCKCRVLPGLGKLHSLKYLEICGADEVKVVGGEFYGKGDDRVKGRVFPRLKNLFFDAMSNWEEWKLTKEYGEVGMDEEHILRKATLL